MRSHIIATLVLVLVAAACGGSVQDSDGPLVIYSGRSEELVAPLIEQFKNETGIEVEVRYGDSTELAATLLEEGSSTAADVFFAQDPASLGAVNDLFDTLPTEILSSVPERFSDTSARWVGVSGRVRVLVYNPELVSESDLPGSVFNLTDERWSGRIGIAPTNGSFLAFVASMILVEGEEKTLEWLKGLAANHPVDYPKNSPIVEAVDAGDIAVGLVNHYYLLRLRSEKGGSTARNHFFSGGDPGGLVMPAGIGILAATDQPQAARRFVEFLLGADSQRFFAEKTFEYPLVTGVAASPDLPPIDSLSTPAIDLSQLAGALDRATDLVTEAGLL